MFTRNGNDILLDLIVSYPEAVLGTDLEIPTLLGKARLKVEPGTQSGKILRMRGKGIPELNGSRAGDQLVRVNVWIPTKLSKEEKDLVRDLENHENFKPKEGDRSAHSDRSFFAKVRDIFT